MPRKLRIQYPGAMYHVMSRGDGGGRIYLEDVDRHDFIKTLAEACQKTGWQVQAYCLMSNHYHLVLETPEPNLVAPDHPLAQGHRRQAMPWNFQIGQRQAARVYQRWRSTRPSWAFSRHL
jgi:REP element-mobilizing transposase RayT